MDLLHYISPEVIGAAGAVVTALLSLIPFFGASDQRRNLTALVTLFILALFFGDHSQFTSVASGTQYLFEILLTSLVLYKSVLQSLVVEPIKYAIAKRNYQYRAKMMVSKNIFE